MPSTTSSKKPKPAPKARHEWAFEAIGTHWWIGIYEPATTDTLQQLQSAIEQYIASFDRTFSRFRSDSLVMRIAQAPGQYDIGSDGAQMLDIYQKLYAATDGAVTPLIGKTMAAAGYDATYSLQPKRPQPAIAWTDGVMTLSGTMLSVQQPVLLDFGAVGKGYLVDRICERIHALGIRDYCVDGSGDVFVSAGLNLRIGLEHPADASKVIGVAELSAQAMCGSAGNRRRWGDYHHIIDPRTARPTHDVRAVWAVANSAAMADGLSTALFFVEPAQLRHHFDFEYVVVDRHFHSTYSADFPGTLFT
jgi:thiamine biosynthesis lipoprotein